MLTIEPLKNVAQTLRSNLSESAAAILFSWPQMTPCGHDCKPQSVLNEHRLQWVYIGDSLPLHHEHD